MTDRNSLTLFDQLATEIIFEIFDYLSCNDILYTFFDFNQRFNSILLQYQHFLNNFQLPTTNINFWQTILPIIGSQMQYLIITTIDFSLSLDFFPNLKSLIISSPIPICCEGFYPIFECKQFPKLNLFQIKTEIFHIEKSREDYKRFRQILFQKIFNDENCLKTFECLSELSLYNSREINHLIINVNIQSLSLKSTHCIDAFILLKYTPNLKSFNLIVTSFYHNDQLNQNLNLSQIKLERFSLTLFNDIKHAEIYEMNFFSLINLIKQFSSTLIYLSLNLNRVCICESNTFLFNGTLLEQQLLESMIQLKQFHFYAKLNQQPIDAENVLLSFKNRFWFDHHWSIGMHGRHFYTLPFHYNKLDDFIHFDYIQSSNSNILNSPYPWYHVTSIVLSGWWNLNLNLIKQLRIKMTNLISIQFTSPFELIPEYEENIIDTTLDNVTTVHCRCESMEDMKPWFICILPNVKHLVLLCSPEFVADLYDQTNCSREVRQDFHDDQIRTDYVHFSKIQNVEIKVLSKTRDDSWMYGAHLITKILSIFKYSKSFLFHFYLIRYHSSNIPIVDLRKIYLNSTINEILKYYQMKQSYNYLQFVKIDHQ